MSDDDYDSIVRKAVVAAAACGPLAMSPIPLTDTVAVAGIWGTMMVAIARKNGHQVDADAAKRVALAVIAQAGAYYTGSKMFGWVLAKIPGIGWVTGSGVNSTLNAAFTVWLACHLIDLFEVAQAEADVPYYIGFLQDAMKPSGNVRQLRRIRGFFKRWARMEA